AASGTFAYGVEFEDIVHLGRLGGIVVKGLSREPMAGNPPPRLYETAAGMLNAIGLQNIGARAFIEEKLPKLRAMKDVVVIANIARVAEEAGADAISLVNTFMAMAIDAESRKPRIANVTAGLSGPAIKPIALRMVYDASKAVKIPVIGIGGISTAADIIEFMLAGATAVEIGTASFWDP